MRCSLFVLSYFLCSLVFAENLDFIEEKPEGILINDSIISIWSNDAFYYSDFNLDTAFILIDKAYKNRHKIVDQKLLAQVISRKGLITHRKGDWKTGLSLMAEALEIREKNRWFTEIGKSFIDIGNAYCEEAEKLFDTDSALSDTLFKSAISYYQDALSNFQEQSVIREVGLANYCIGRAYFLLYEDSLAIKSYYAALEAYQSIEDSSNIVDVAMALKRSYSYLEDEDSVAYFTMLADRMDQGKILDLRDKIQKQLGEGISKTKDGSYAKAIMAYLKADSLATVLGDVNTRIEILDKLSILYDSIHDYKQAFFYQKSLNDYRSMALTSKAVEKSAVFNKKYDSAKNKAEVARQISENLKKDNVIYVVSSFTLLSLLALFWSRNSHKKNKQLQEQENQKLLKDLEIKSMEAALDIRDVERKRIAEDLHDRLGNTLTATRMLFEASMVDTEAHLKTDKAYKLLDKAIAETRHIAYNMLSGVLVKFGLEAALMDLKSTMEEVGELSVKVKCENLDERLNMDLELNIYRIVQELVGNALKYAKASFISISILRNGDYLMIMVKDDGKGFDTSVNGKGMGMKNINTRVQKFKGNWICESAQGRGTKTEVNFKLNEEGDQDFISR